jgi:Rhodococcus equi virulence-associated protein
MESNQPNVSNETLAADFRTLFQGKISDAVIESTTQALLNQSSKPQGVAKTQMASAADSDTTYSANGSIASLALYMDCKCQISGGKNFHGKAWGVSTPGGGALFGDVYLNCGSLNELYSRTDSFTLAAAFAYTSFYFYDRDGNYLGSFQSGSVSTVAGTGGGSGSWS